MRAVQMQVERVIQSQDVSKQVLSGSTQFHGCLKQVGHVQLNHWDSCSKNISMMCREWSQEELVEIPNFKFFALLIKICHNNPKSQHNIQTYFAKQFLQLFYTHHLKHIESKPRDVICRFALQGYMKMCQFKFYISRF